MPFWKLIPVPVFYLFFRIIWIFLCKICLLDNSFCNNFLLHLVDTSFKFFKYLETRNWLKLWKLEEKKVFCCFKQYGNFNRNYLRQLWSYLLFAEAKAGAEPPIRWSWIEAIFINKNCGYASFSILQYRSINICFIIFILMNSYLI